MQSVGPARKARRASRNEPSERNPRFGKPLRLSYTSYPHAMAGRSNRH